jgi:hypothetical protein
MEALRQTGRDLSSGPLDAISSLATKWGGSTMRALLSMVALALVVASPAAAEDRVAVARSHFVAGEAAFRAGNYEIALIEFQTGYALVPRPEFLLDLGNTLRKLNRLSAAREKYEAYLQAVPDSPHAARVREVLDQLRAQGVESPEAPRDTPPPTASPPTPTPTTAPTTTTTATATTTASRPERTPVYKRWWLWTIVGVVVAGGAVTAAVLLTRNSGFDPNLPATGPGAKTASLALGFRF